MIAYYIEWLYELIKKAICSGVCLSLKAGGSSLNGWFGVKSEQVLKKI